MHGVQTDIPPTPRFHDDHLSILIFFSAVIAAPKRLGHTNRNNLTMLSTLQKDLVKNWKGFIENPNTKSHQLLNGTNRLLELGDNSEGD